MAAPEPLPTLIGDVAFSVPSQAFEGALDATMTTSIVGAEIRFTTDGELPTSRSMLYAGTALPISDTTQLRAQAFVGGVATGNVSTALYLGFQYEGSRNVNDWYPKLTDDPAFMTLVTARWHELRTAWIDAQYR